MRNNNISIKLMEFLENFQWSKMFETNEQYRLKQVKRIFYYSNNFGTSKLDEKEFMSLVFGNDPDSAIEDFLHFIIHLYENIAHGEMLCKEIQEHNKKYREHEI